MNINIRKSTDYIQKQLFLNKTGTVHSVYQKTINIRMGTMLFALQSCGSPVSPVSMICNLSEEDFSSLHIQVNDPVSVSEDKLFIQSADLLYCFHFSGCRVLTVHPGTPLPSAHAELIQMAIDHSHTGGFRNLFTSSISAVPDPEFLILPAVRTILDECRDLVTKKSYPDAAICLSRLIGIGIGLTPSGDDFLCGILAGFPLWNAASHPLFLQLQKLLPDCLARTNDISRTFLRCALDGYFSEAIQYLADCISEEEILQSFEAIGHSSGMDSLSGILFVHELLYFHL